MTHGIEQAIFDVSRSLEVPVLVLALLALAAVIVELGGFAAELRSRRRRHFPTLVATAALARAALESGSRDKATVELRSVAWSAGMTDVLTTIAEHAREPGGDTRLAKSLADFDFNSQRRLSRTRLLVRTGPALGLMGTLIPLSPALSGLAKGDVDQLSHNLRVAFSVTVLGLLIGAVSFALSLYRDRMYGQDLSDLEYVAAVLTDDHIAPVPVTPPPPAAAAKPAEAAKPEPAQSEPAKPEVTATPAAPTVATSPAAPTPAPTTPVPNTPVTAPRPAVTAPTPTVSAPPATAAPAPPTAPSAAPPAAAPSTPPSTPPSTSPSSSLQQPRQPGAAQPTTAQPTTAQPSTSPAAATPPSPPVPPTPGAAVPPAAPSVPSATPASPPAAPTSPAAPSTPIPSSDASPEKPPATSPDDSSGSPASS